MRRMLPWMMVLALVVAVPAFGAAAKKGKKDDDKENISEKRDRLRDNWPSAREVERAIDRIEGWNKDKVASTRFRGKAVEFVACDVGHKKEEEKANGFILGKLISDTDSKDGLSAGTYMVYATKLGSRWDIYFFTRGDVVAKSKNVVQGLDETETPAFKSAGAVVRTWRVEFDW